MCLAIPGKIVKIKGDKAIVKYGTVEREARLIDTSYKVGDYVLMSTGIVIQRIPKEEALRAIGQIKNS